MNIFLKNKNLGVLNRIIMIYDDLEQLKIWWTEFAKIIIGGLKSLAENYREQKCK